MSLAHFADFTASLSPYGHPRAAVPQYGRRYHREGTIMKKLSMIGIVGGAALLAAVPLSLQWSQVGPAVPLLTVSHANAQYYGPSRRHVHRVYRRAYRRAYGGYPSSTEDILPPILPATEDILPASDNIPVRFTVGIVISAKLSHLA